MSRIPALVKRGWQFRPHWEASLGLWYVFPVKAAWGLSLRGGVWSRDWDRAHEHAADWAEGEEAEINEERHDTDRAPAMEESNAAE